MTSINPFQNETVRILSELPNWWIAVANGEVEGASFVNKFGENNNIGTSEEVIWDAGGDYPYITTASVLDIVSTDADDNAAGTGARTVSIQGLDAEYNQVEEVVELNGTAAVQTTNLFIRVFRMVVITAGTSEGAEGQVQAKIGSTVHAQIINGNNQTLMALYTVPAGKSAILLYGKASAGKGKDMTGSFFARRFGGVFNLQHRFYQYQNSYDFPFMPSAPLLPEKTDLEVRAKSDAAGTPLSAAFNILLVDNI